MEQDFSFTISESYTPATIPMERLAEYLVNFARLLGETANVHFDRVVESSVALRAYADVPAVPKVQARLDSLRTGTATVEVAKAFNDLDEMLRRDNAIGALAGGGVVIPFPGKRKTPPPTYGPFKQEGTIDGQVYRIGGKDETKHVHIRNGEREYSTLIATEILALKLRHHLFGDVLRFSGTGTWFRHGNGDWELRKFDVTDFEPLDDAPFANVLKRLRAVPARALSSLSDPVSALLAERRDSGEPA